MNCNGNEKIGTLDPVVAQYVFFLGLMTSVSMEPRRTVIAIPDTRN